MNKELCPEIHYRREGKKLILTGCYGIDGSIYIPDELDGQSIDEIGPYAFAEGVDGGDSVWFSEESEYVPERHRICTEEVIEIRLPGKITNVGRYAFYRCRNLKRLILTDSLSDIGGGALTGCHPAEVVNHFYKGEQSALKSILEEVRFSIRAVLYYHMADGGVREARVLFPEHYEEAVENTPARILETHHHGSGNYYRQCFYGRELDYRKYDELLPYAVSQEDEKTAAELVLGRLMYPYKLSEHARRAYEEYMHAHICRAVCYAVENDAKEVLHFLAQGRYMNQDALDAAVEKAAELGRTEITGMLMDEWQRGFAGRKKRFEL